MCRTSPHEGMLAPQFSLSVAGHRLVITPEKIDEWMNNNFRFGNLFPRAHQPKRDLTPGKTNLSPAILRRCGFKPGIAIELQKFSLEKKQYLHYYRPRVYESPMNRL